MNYLSITFNILIAMLLCVTGCNEPLETASQSKPSQASGTALGTLARDAYTVGHYPLVAGVILFAVGTEELLAHPEAALDAGARWAFFGGLAAFLGAQAIMTLRLTGRLAWERFSMVVVLFGAAATLVTASGAVLAVIAVAIVLAGLTIEAARHWEELGALR